MLVDNRVSMIYDYGRINWRKNKLSNEQKQETNKIKVEVIFTNISIFNVKYFDMIFKKRHKNIIKNLKLRDEILVFQI